MDPQTLEVSEADILQSCFDPNPRESAKTNASNCLTQAIISKETEVRMLESALRAAKIMLRRLKKAAEVK